ncbi:four-domain proteases inhibitor-like [Haliotis rubra]|uniref:four-domain proteases inhibitor-like n=1 Tax=Haliotis rubra TaxID=36100 RepID=UPI001EE5ACC6|nr:four-domain proteases inhibitor-like [Haliotis rubra]
MLKTVLLAAAVILMVDAADDCLRPCLMMYSPVCATFTKTYGNECMMKADACSLAKQGVHLMTKTDTVCSCERACPFLLSPVCATDGITYDNECLMGVAACKQNKWLEVKSSGQCPAEN